MSDAAESDTEGQPSNGSGPLPRPHFQLRSLPIRYRWEVTRRHPYYQDWWKVAREHHRNEPVGHPAHPFLRQAAIAILGAIGVSGEPVDPATDFEELDTENMNSAWLSGAVHPITFRGLAGLLLAVLPKETLAQLGYKFVVAACEDEEGELPRKVRGMPTVVFLKFALVANPAGYSSHAMP